MLLLLRRGGLQSRAESSPLPPAGEGGAQRRERAHQPSRTDNRSTRVRSFDKLRINRAVRGRVSRVVPCLDTPGRMPLDSSKPRRARHSARTGGSVRRSNFVLWFSMDVAGCSAAEYGSVQILGRDTRIPAFACMQAECSAHHEPFGPSAPKACIEGCTMPRYTGPDAARFIQAPSGPALGTNGWWCATFELRALHLFGRSLDAA
jgi:hypothetical protein